MTEQQIREIFRQELAAFFSSAAPKEQRFESDFGKRVLAAKEALAEKKARRLSK